MVIKCIVAGTLDLTPLNFQLHGGQIVDLHSLFSHHEINRELRQPDGCIYQAYRSGWIRDVRLGSSEHRDYVKQIEIEHEKKIREEIKNNSRKIMINYFKKTPNEKISFIKSLTFSYYDFIQELKKTEKDQNIVYEIYKKIGEFSERKIQEGFVLL